MLFSSSSSSLNSEVSQVFSENISSRSTTLTESSTQSEIRQHFGNEDFSGELPKKLIQLKKLKNGGTTIKKAKEDLEYCYDSLRLYENPYVTSSVDKKCGYSIELYLDNKYKTLMFSDLQLNADYPLYYDSSLDNISTNVERERVTPLQIKGKIRINIDREDQALLITSHSISLKCFTKEYACFVNSETSKNSYSDKIIKELNHTEFFESSTYPKQQLRVIHHSLNDKKILLTKGTYDYPFTFTLQANTFPASFSSFFGKTHFRIESLTTIMRIPSKPKNLLKFLKNESFTDKIILTEEIKVKRVLPSTSMLKFETFQLRSYNTASEIVVSVIGNSKLIEIGMPFQMILSITKTDSSIELQEASLAVAQRMAIPSIDLKTKKILREPYIKKSEYLLRTVESQSFDSDKTIFGFCFDDVVIPTYADGLPSWFKTFYCEPSSFYPNHAALKVTHLLLFRITYSRNELVEGLEMKKNYRITVNFPILVGDSDISTSSLLPKYEKFENISDLQDEPPLYSMVAGENSL
ncbi:AHL_G0004370.mRNA.1.CDS.1 [Saccharomyces cerevisiae]|nr:Spo23p [Saccharomyces cerevisiae YJM1252]CAI4273048.1 CPG_1a_G0004360.mRNA.1.CDS.1 [Saccharomyces cerevisiae]CAI4278952.1 AVB_G0004270.mRNA.1.CDS.1 [Saccharomyces cerevisiae]CAI4282289.1 AMP_1a_G0004670.mRNA.1.CDS.1 [Saccharomyces cerevisiae]CAI4868159.1 AHL_G0004370.mRNA.1.CDS.1 [Saccharomyces cerevisiae]